MFQAIKRAKFLSQNNFKHYDTGDLVQMHLWLQKKGWPANQFVDMFMLAHPNFDPMYNRATFEQFMCRQYYWLQHADIDALRGLSETVNSDKFRAADKFGIGKLLANLVREASLKSS